MIFIKPSGFFYFYRLRIDLGILRIPSAAARLHRVVIVIYNSLTITIFSISPFSPE